MSNITEQEIEKLAEGWLYSLEETNPQVLEKKYPLIPMKFGFKEGYKAALQNKVSNEPEEFFSSEDYQEGKCTIDQLIESDKRLDKVSHVQWWEKEFLIQELINEGYDKTLAGNIVADLEKIKNNRNENN